MDSMEAELLKIAQALTTYWQESSSHKYEGINFLYKNQSILLLRFTKVIGRIIIVNNNITIQFEDPEILFINENTFLKYFIMKNISAFLRVDILT